MLSEYGKYLVSESVGRIVYNDSVREVAAQNVQVCVSRIGHVRASVYPPGVQPNKVGGDVIIRGGVGSWEGYAG